MSKYIKNLIEEEFVDHETGEVKGSRKISHFRVKVEQSPYYMIYIDTDRIYEIEKASDLKIFLVMAEMATYNLAEIPMTVKSRRTISKKAKVSHMNLSRNLSRLVDMGFLFIEEGTYYINPHITWKGDRKVRAAVLENKEFMDRFITKDASLSNVQNRIDKTEI